MSEDVQPSYETIKALIPLLKLPEHLQVLESIEGVVVYNKNVKKSITIYAIPKRLPNSLCSGSSTIYGCGRDHSNVYVPDKYIMSKELVRRLYERLKKYMEE